MFLTYSESELPVFTVCVCYDDGIGDERFESVRGYTEKECSRLKPDGQRSGHFRFCPF